MTYLAGCGQTSMDIPTPDTSPNISAISPVTDLVAEPALTEIGLTWTNPDYASPYYVRVQFKKSDESVYQVAATLEGASSYQLTNLASLQEYDIRVQTITADGKSSAYSDEIKSTTDFAQTELKHPTLINAVTSFLEYNSVKTTWTWSETDFSNLASVDIYRQTYSSGTWVDTTKHVSSTDVSFSENPAASSVKYRFTINYKDGQSANIEPTGVSYTLPNVTVVSAAVIGITPNQDIKLTLTWVNTTHSDGLKSYEIQRKGVSDISYSTIATIDTSGTVPVNTYTDTMVTSSNGSVTYRIKANYYYDSTGYDYSPASGAVAIAATPLADPTSVSITSSGGSDHATLSWTYSASAVNVEFEIASIAVSDTGGQYPSYETIPYELGKSSYSYEKYFANTACAAGHAFASKLKFTIQAKPIDANVNTASNVIATGEVSCNN